MTPRQPSMEQAVALALIACVVAAVSWRWFGLLTWHDSQRLLQCGLLLMLGFGCIVDGGFRGRLMAQAGRFGPVCVGAAAAVLGIGVLSAVASGFARFGLLEVSLFALSGLLALAVMAARRSAPAFDVVVLAAVAAACTVLVVQFLSAYAAAMLSGSAFHADALYRGGFSNPRFLGQFQTLALPLLVAACLHPGFALRWRAVVFTVLVFSLVLGLLTASRASWYAWAIATLVVLAVFPPARRPTTGVVLPALACGAVVFHAMFYWIPPLLVEGFEFAAREASFGRLAQPFGLSLRDVVWARAIEWTLAFPLLGIGPMGLALDLNPVAAHPHSAPLQLAAEWGLPAAVLAGLAVLAVVFRLWMGLRRIARDPSAWGGSPAVLAATVIALLGAGIHALVDGVIVMPCSQLMLALVAGWAAACLLPAEAAPPAARAHRSRAAAFAAAAAVVALFNGLAPDVAILDLRMQDRIEDELAGRPMVTRFWSQGWLNGSVAPDGVRFLQPRP